MDLPLASERNRRRLTDSGTYACSSSGHTPTASSLARNATRSLRSELRGADSRHRGTPTIERIEMRASPGPNLGHRASTTHCLSSGAATVRIQVECFAHRQIIALRAIEAPVGGQPRAWTSARPSMGASAPTPFGSPARAANATLSWPSESQRTSVDDNACDQKA